MGLSTNTDLQSVFSQVSNLLNKLPSDSSGSSSFNAEEFFQLGNLLNGSTSGTTSSSGTSSDNTANTIQTTINKVMSLIDKITNQEAKAASNEIKKNKQAADELKKEQENAKAELSQNIENIEAEIATENETVINSTASLEEVNEQLAEKQEQINEIVKQIEEQQQLLASAKTPEEKAAILGTIQGLSGQIGELVGNIGDLQEQVASLSQAVETSVTNIETAKGNAVTIQEDGEMKITQLVQEGANLVTTNTSSQVQGVTNTVTGKALEAAAETASSNMFSASTAPQLYRAANDQSTAGQTRTSGSLTNLQTVLQGIGGLQDNLSLLTNFETSIGNALSEFSGAVGSWNTAIDPIITSIGSFETVQSGNEELQAAVTSDLGSLGYTAEVDEEGNVQLSKENGEESGIENGETPVALQTSEFDVQGKLNLFEKVQIGV